MLVYLYPAAVIVLTSAATYSALDTFTWHTQRSMQRFLLVGALGPVSSGGRIFDPKFNISICPNS